MVSVPMAVMATAARSFMFGHEQDTIPAIPARAGACPLTQSVVVAEKRSR
jgi:hypothetical protein